MAHGDGREQRARFIEDVPPDHPPVLIDEDLGVGARPISRPMPLGVAQAAVGEDTRPARRPTFSRRGEEHWLTGRNKFVAPTLIVRGEWDSVSNDRDADWLLSRVSAPIRKDVKIAKGTHLMHLEHSRDALFATVREFLSDTVRP